MRSRGSSKLVISAKLDKRGKYEYHPRFLSLLHRWYACMSTRWTCRERTNISSMLDVLLHPGRKAERRRSRRPKLLVTGSTVICFVVGVQLAKSSRTMVDHSSLPWNTCLSSTMCIIYESRDIIRRQTGHTSLKDLTFTFETRYTKCRTEMLHFGFREYTRCCGLTE